MNIVVKELKKIVNANLKEYLPHINQKDLIEKGSIYYSKPSNGTNYDYYVNEVISDFMVYYNDEKKYGAVKMRLHTNGEIIVYIYDDHGDKLIKKYITKIEVPEEDILKLAIILKTEVDDKNIWGENIEKLDTDKKITKEQIKQFEKFKEEKKETIEKGHAFSRLCLASKRIIEENYKVGIMLRVKPIDEKDSGWRFYAGNEDEKYLDNPKNIVLTSVQEIYFLDSSIWNYLGKNVSTFLVKTKTGKFEEDDTENVYIEKN